MNGPVAAVSEGFVATGSAMAKPEKNFPVMAEPARSLSRLRRERLVIRDNGRSRGEVARGSRALRSRGWLELVEAVEEGAESAEIATIEGDAETGEGGEFGFIGFLGVGSTGGDEGLGAEDIVKIFVETDESASGDLSVDADEHDVSDIAIGVEVVVEVDHFTTGEFEVVGNLEEGEVLLGDETISE